MADNNIDPNVLPETYRRIYDLLGPDGLLTIYENFKGEEINLAVHLYDRQKVRLKVIEEFNGSNADALARRYGFTKRWVRSVINEQRRQQLDHNSSKK